MSPHEDHAAWDAQRAVLRALVFDAATERARSSSITAGHAFLVRTDARQVERTAARLRVDVLARRRRGAVALTESFAGSLAGVPLEAHADLAARFCGSRWFAEHGEVPDRSDQLSAEEAFYRFLCDEQLGAPELRLAEFADAMISALAVQPRSAFRIPTEIERAPFGYFALVELSGRTLVFAATKDRVVRGPIDRAAAEVLRHRGDRPPASELPAPAWDAAIERLASAGLRYRAV
jgi:hypothetical protein